MQHAAEATPFILSRQQSRVFSSKLESVKHDADLVPFNVSGFFSSPSNYQDRKVSRGSETPQLSSSSFYNSYAWDLSYRALVRTYHGKEIGCAESY